MLTFIYLHCQAPPSMFCRGRYKNSGDWLIDWLIDWCCIKSFTPCTLYLGLVAELCPTFCSQLDWGQGCSVATNLEVYRGDHDLWYHCTFGVEAANDAQTVWVNTPCRNEHSQKNLSKPILWCRNVYNQISADIWEIDNPVHKLRTDKPRPVLINVLIWAIF